MNSEALYIKGLDHMMMKRYEEAVAALLLTPGHKTAQFMIGSMYQLGQGVPKHPGEGLLWMRRSAQQGHPPAQVSNCLPMLANAR